MRTYLQDRYWFERAKHARSLLIRNALARVAGYILSLEDEQWFLRKESERATESFNAFALALKNARSARQLN